MHKLIAIWSAPRPKDAEAFEDHYVNVHVPAAAAVPNLRRLVAVRTDSGLDGAASAFYRVAEMYFDSIEDLHASEKTEAWAAMREDAGLLIDRFGVSLEVGIGQATDAEVKPE